MSLQTMNKKLKLGIASIMLGVFATAGLQAAMPGRALAAWSVLEKNGRSVFLACKTAQESGYGPVWKVTLVLASARGERVSSNFSVMRDGKTISTVFQSAAHGQWSVKTIYASRYFNDKYSYSMGSTNSGGGDSNVSFSRIGSC